VAPDDFEDRELCPDELCTGIIGEDGRCGTCGRMREGEAPPGKKAAAASDAPDAPDDDDVEVETGEPGGDEDGGEVEESAGSSAYDPDERIPCPDELCTGIIGPDGRCGTCGRRA
jgi:hypothetical protein